MKTQNDKGKRRSSHGKNYFARQTFTLFCAEVNDQMMIIYFRTDKDEAVEKLLTGPINYFNIPDTAPVAFY